MSVMLTVVVVHVQCAPVESTTEMAYLPPVSTPEITFYEYTPTDTGYMYR